MCRKLYPISIFFISLLFSFVSQKVNGQNITFQWGQDYEASTGSGYDPGDIVAIKVDILNYETSTSTNSSFYAKIPAGTAYVPGSTKLNGVPVADVEGKMPFSGSGALINTPGSAPGVIPVAYGMTPEIEYSFQITGNIGDVTNYSTLQGTLSTGNYLLKSTSVYGYLGTATCNTIYQSTAAIQSGAPTTYPYKYIKTLNTTNGTVGATIASGGSVPSFDAVTGGTLSSNSVLTDAEALALDPRSNRLYFINGTTNSPAQDLCYIDLNTNYAYRYTGYPLETNTGTGYNIDRMTFGSDGYGYALTDNGQDLIRFSIDPATNLPIITSLGPLVADPNNGLANVFSSPGGGDMFADGSGYLYLYTNTASLPNSRQLFRIDPATRIATSLGTLRGVIYANNNAAAIDENGNLFVGGSYQDVYKADLTTMIGGSITSGTTNVWKTGDYASCALPILKPAMSATKSYTNITTTGASTVKSGDVIEYTITVTNTGNLTATNTILYDALPAGTHYIPNSTTRNGLAVADISGSMPYSIAGGQLISTKAEPAYGIVKPGTNNAVVIKFRVTTDANVNICNQATIDYTDFDGSTMHIVTGEGPYGQTPTCFYSDKGLDVTKTFTNTITRPNNAVISGDPVIYTITVTNLAGGNANNVNVYDAIPAYAHYRANTTTMNGVAVPDNGGLMPFSVSGGALINSTGQSAGVVVPGDANKVVISFTVTTDALKQVCNQANISLTDASGIVKNFSSDDPSVSGTQDATCFFSDGALCEGCRTAVNSTTNAAGEQVQPFISAEVRPNPFNKVINLQVQSNTSEQLRVRLIDFYGRTVYTTTHQIGAGFNSLHIDAPASLASGIYILELASGNNRVLQKKLIKQ